MNKQRPLLVIALLVGIFITLTTRVNAAGEDLVPESYSQVQNLPAVGLSYKIVVDADGLYRLTYADLQAAGLPVDSINPQTLKVWEQGEEVAIYVEGEADGRFDPGDAVYFYGRMARTRFQDPNIYWLTYGGNPGKRMTLRVVSPGAAPAPSPYRRTIRLEEDKIYRSNLPMEVGADHWFWESYFACAGAYCLRDDTKTYTVTLPNLASGTFTATLRIALQGVSDALPNPDHHVVIYVNGTKVGDAYWDGTNAFIGEYPFPQSLLTPGDNVITYTAPLDIPGVTQDRGFTNWLELTYYDTYQAEGNSLTFRLEASGTWRTEVSGFTRDDLFLLDITDPRNPSWLTDYQVNGTGSGYTLVFQDTVASGERSYIAVAGDRLHSPASIELDTPSDLKNPNNGADWIAITHRDFLTYTLQLAAHRAAFSGLRTVVVDVQDIYDEFSGGLMDPEAIRQFLAYARDNWTPPAPQYVLLVGDGTYDYKNNLNAAEKMFIPPYLDLVDCFLGETAADNRFVAGPRTSSNPNALECQKHAMPYMAIGRLPVNNAQEAQSAITRIICYEDPNNALCAGLPAPAPGWEQRAIFVADKNDSAGAFTCHSDEVAGQQRCPDQDFGFRPISPRAPVKPTGEIKRDDLQPLAVLSPQVTTRMGFIGDYIWLDSDGDGWPDVTESGINGVIINLWEDVDRNNVLSPPDRKIATVQTGDNPATPEVESGWYGFDGLDKSNYLVEIDPVNFQPGGALEGLTLSAGQNPWPVHMDGLIPDEYERIKIYLQDEASPGVIPYPTGNSARSALIDAINQGAAFVTYNGHATTFRWSGGALLDIYAIPNLTNAGMWPVFLPMTCLESQFQYIGLPSLGESLIRAVDDNGNPIGAVAVWGPTGLGVATGQIYLFTGFFEAVYQYNITTIGDAILFAKRKLYESDSIFKDLIETYTLLGDPAMRLQVPRPDIRVDKSVTPTGFITPGDTVTYTISLTNDGPLSAWNVTITETLPANFIPEDWTASNPTLTLRPGTTYIWDMPELSPGTTVTITLRGRVNPATPPGTSLINRVRVTSGTGDRNLTNNEAVTISDVGTTFTIQGYTYQDTDASRSFSPGESGLGGVGLTLLDTGGTVLASTTSDTTGAYAFTGLTPGTYVVRVTVPDGFVPTEGTEKTVAVVDASVMDVNFGFIAPTSVQLVALDVQWTGQEVILRWAARDERAVQEYSVYRARTVGGERPVMVATLPAQGVPGTVWYTTTDRPPGDGRWYYWVTAHTQSGEVTTFGPAMVVIAPSPWRYYIPWTLR